MWRPYGAVQPGAGEILALDTNAPPESLLKRDVVALIIEVLPDNRGRVYICSSAAATPLANPPVGLLKWLPPPSPGNAPYIIIRAGLRPSQYFVAAEVPGEGVNVSGVVQ